MGKIQTKTGDGWPLELTEAQMMKEIEEGTMDASERGGIPPISEDEKRHL